MGIFSRKKTDAPIEPATKAAATSVVKKSVEKKSVEKKAPVQTKTVNTPASTLILLPMVTEKTTVNGTYVFKVKRSATKNEVSKAFKVKYGKTPRKVNMLNVMGKTKLRGRTVGKRSDWKKAIVYLTKGETVDIYQ